MLLPPGIRNRANICFASSVLQYLLNQQLFKTTIEKLQVSHMPTCEECQQSNAARIMKLKLVTNIFLVDSISMCSASSW